MFKKMKQKVLKANLALREYGLAPFTWGNASQIDPKREYIIIKPSGVRYEDMTWDQMCVVSMEDGSLVGGAFSPSTDTRTHMEIYRRFPSVNGIAHTHSVYATAFAQAGLGIPCYGTTHADYFYGEIPCARALRADEIQGDYELNTGRVIVETFQSLEADPLAIPGALVSGHGAFAWGNSAGDAAANAAYLEETARLAYMTLQLAPPAGVSLGTGVSPSGVSPSGVSPVPRELLDKHYNRKHGKDAYYGQKLV